MDIDDRIASALQALARASVRGLPSVDDTARALASRPRRRHARLRPLAMAALALALVLAWPVPYSRQRGFDVRIAEGKVALVPHLERVWGPLVAMAREKLHIDVDLQAGRPEKIEAEIKRQLAQQGWSADLVDVRRLGPLGVPQDDGTQCVIMPAITLVTIDAHGHDQQLHLIVNRDLTSPWQRLTVRGATVEAVPMPADNVIEHQIRARLEACHVDGAELEVKDGNVRLLMRR